VTDRYADEPYGLIVAPAASRAISEVLPENAAWAVIDFINGRLLANPHRIGYPLHGRLDGLSFDAGNEAFVITRSQECSEPAIMPRWSWVPLTLRDGQGSQPDGLVGEPARGGRPAPGVQILSALRTGLHVPVRALFTFWALPCHRIGRGQDQGRMRPGVSAETSRAIV
jgi:hypothetical protein